MTYVSRFSPDFSTLQKKLPLTDIQTKETKNLVLNCCLHDSIRLSYPAEPRRKGCFDALLSRALEDFEEYDILFPVSGACPDTLNTLEALGAQLDTTEYQMEWTSQTTDSTQNQMQLPYSQEKANQSDTFLNSSPSPDDSETLCWSFHTGISESPSSDCPVGTFLTTWTGNDCVCLHQVEILPAFRSQGLGTAMIQLFLDMAAQKNISRVILQVSADNHAALALYKKTGFRITEALSFYFY